MTLLKLGDVYINPSSVQGLRNVSIGWGSPKTVIYLAGTSVTVMMHVEQVIAALAKEEPFESDYDEMVRRQRIAKEKP